MNPWILTKSQEVFFVVSLCARNATILPVWIRVGDWSPSRRSPPFIYTVWLGSRSARRSASRRCCWMVKEGNERWKDERTLLHPPPSKGTALFTRARTRRQNCSRAEWLSSNDHHRCFRQRFRLMIACKSSGGRVLSSIAKFKVLHLANIYRT